ncbi:MAG: acetyl esterase [Actinomycetota bacterium]|jgi:acetyl esterase|nr:acetyl esterase [Actinomycetota bacterium]
MAMEIDAALIPVMAGLDLSPTDIATERARGEAGARALVGILTEPVPDSVSVRDIRIPGEVEIPARVYTPTATTDGNLAGLRGGMVFAHGGGWTTGSPNTAHEHVGAMAAGADVVIVSIDYRLVPEHPFPAGLDDTITAIRWVAANAAELGIDPQRIAIGGESAGGNLVAAAAIQLRDAGGPPIVLQLLEVPVLDLGRPDTDSRREIVERFPIFGAADVLIAERYPGPDADSADPRISPLKASDLTGLPPALLLAADVDPVRDDSVLYAAQLTGAGVPARVRVFPGIVHGTAGFTVLLPSAREWLDECVTALRTMSVTPATPADPPEDGRS